MKKNSSFATLSLILVTAAWGLTFTLIKDAIQDISPLSFVALRFLSASLILAFGLKVMGRKSLLASTSAEWGAGVLLGILLYLGYALQTYGLKFTTASNAGFVTGMSVVLVPLITVVMGSGTVKRSSWTGVLLSVTGLAMLSVSGRFEVNAGDLMVLFCAVAFAFHIVFVGRFAATFDPSRMTWIQITVCGLLAALSAPLMERAEWATLPSKLANVKVLGALGFCAVVATAVAYWVQNTFQRYSTPVRTALIFTCEPVFSAIFGYLFAGETLAPKQILGCAFVLIGMVVTETGEAIVAAIRATRPDS